MQTKLTHLCILILAAGLAAHCASDTKAPVARSSTQDSTDKKNSSDATCKQQLRLQDTSIVAVTYQAQLAALVTQRCATCHGKDQQAPDLTTFDSIKADDFKIARQMVDEVQDLDMPRPDPLKTEEIQQFAAWRDGGFKLDQTSAPFFPPKADAGTDSQMTTDTQVATIADTSTVSTEQLGKDNCK